MTNLQEAVNSHQILWRRRLLLGLPIAAAGLVSTAITILFTLPQWLALQSSAARLQQLHLQQQQVPLLRDQLAKISAEIDQSESKQRKLLQMIEGSGEFATFLAQLDREASRHGLQLERFEPTAEAPAPSPPQASGRGNKQTSADQPPVQEPLKAAGLQAERVLMSARGSYPSILAFMRSVERLSLLVVPSDFGLELVEENGGVPVQAADGQEAKILVPELKLALTFYKALEGGGVLPQVLSKSAAAKQPARAR